MITPEYCRTMARYNRWQNAGLYSAAETLEEGARRQDRGAFFGSIHGTLSHLLWGDLMWMSRFDGDEKPPGGTKESATLFPDFVDLRDARTKADIRINDWAAGLGVDSLGGDLSWYSGLLERDVSAPMARCVAHFFNHQTHHRGQVHAMLTAAGARPGVTDLFLMPEDA